jgi:hypothetical protein
MSLHEGEGAATPFSFADILLGSGYGDARTLTSLLEGWIRIFERWRPDLVVADSAPTALIAARILRIRRATYANGFALPPRVSPLPAFPPRRCRGPGRPRRIRCARARPREPGDRRVSR